MAFDHVAMAAAVARVLHRLDPMRGEGEGRGRIPSSSRASLSSKPVSGAPKAVTRVRMAWSNARERIPSSATARVAAGIVAPRARASPPAKPRTWSFSRVRRRSTEHDGFRGRMAGFWRSISLCAIKLFRYMLNGFVSE